MLDDRRDAALAAALCAILPALALWPVGSVESLLSAPGQEAGEHVVGLWLAATTGSPLVVESDLLNWPQGVKFVLIDPLNLLVFAPLARWPYLAYNAVMWVGLSVAGLAGALLSREGGGRLWVGAALGCCLGPLMAMTAEGQTENFTLGWIGLHLLALLSFLRQGGLWRGALAAVTLAACYYGGPYKGIFASVIAAGVGLWWLRRRPRVLLVGVAALLLAAPMVRATLAERDPSLPGGAGREEIPEPPTGIKDYRGGLFHGADLTDAWAPEALTGAACPAGHSAYLGVGFLFFALLGLWRAPRLWPWAAGATLFWALSLGPWLMWRGEVLTLGDGRRMVAPAGLVMRAAPVTQRLTRWYRAGKVTGLLLIPLVAAGLRRREGGPPTEWLTALIVADALLLGPARWPRETIRPRQPEALASLEGPILEIPAMQLSPTDSSVGSENLLLLPLHGQPTSSAFLGLPVAVHQEPEFLTLRDGGRRDRELLPALRHYAEGGFKTVIWYTDHSPLGKNAQRKLNEALGPPLINERKMLVWSLAPLTEAEAEAP